jgi:hypothetical protein
MGGIFRADAGIGRKARFVAMQRYAGALPAIDGQCMSIMAGLRQRGREMPELRRKVLMDEKDVHGCRSRSGKWRRSKR